MPEIHKAFASLIGEWVNLELNLNSYVPRRTRAAKSFTARLTDKFKRLGFFKKDLTTYLDHTFIWVSRSYYATLKTFHLYLRLWTSASMLDAKGGSLRHCEKYYDSSVRTSDG